LQYYLIAGTLLGAVRHKGFIPWDDDLDVAMPRADYELMIANAEQWLPQSYRFTCAENDKHYLFPFAKIQDVNTTLIEQNGSKYKIVGGIYMDVFPLDGVPQGKLAQRIHFEKFRFFKKALFPYKHGNGINSWLPLLCRKLITLEGIQKLIRKIKIKYSFEESFFVSDYDNGRKGIVKKEIFGTPSPVLFEGITFLGVEKQDMYLKQKYGDYMQIPKPEDRQQHYFTYLNFEKPYGEYN
jgi:lipopolysaccharide cholinephosphotransferase